MCVCVLLLTVAYKMFGLMSEIVENSFERSGNLSAFNSYCGLIWLKPYG